MFNKISKELKNIVSWKTNRKIVVFEVDDFGASRINPNHIGNLLKRGFNLSYFEKYDRIAKEIELKQLFNVLKSVKDKKGRYAVFSPFTIMANPDFKIINELNFQKYHYKPFYSTAYDTYQENLLYLWKQGIKDNIFLPQFHGREHFHVSTWMRALNDKKSLSREAFYFDSVGLFGQNTKPEISRFAASFDVGVLDELDDQEGIIESGLKLFEEIFAYKAISFTPPDGFLNTNLEFILSELGIQTISVSRKRMVPIGNKKFNKKFNYLGKWNNSSRIKYTIRNAMFEPHSNVKTDWVNSCLQDINTSFRWRNPAVISSHRVNFLDTTPIPFNNFSGIKQLELLLKSIIKTWPDVEFMSSGELAQIIMNGSGKHNI
jgi:hypothetical protein